MVGRAAVRDSAEREAAAGVVSGTGAAAGDASGPESRREVVTDVTQEYKAICGLKTCS